MRTRFLNIDYATPSFKTLGASRQFLRLPLPHLPPHSHLSAPEDLKSCFNPIPDISPEIENLSIDNALSKFFSDVLPRNLDLRTGGFEITPSTGGTDSSDETRISEEEDETTVVNRDLTIHQFETPELGLFLENSSFSCKEEMQILLGFPEIEKVPEMPKPGHAVLYPSEVHESIYSVQDISVKYPREDKTYLLEGAGSAENQISCKHGPFPLLEVDEISLGLPSANREVLFENIYSQCNTLNDILAFDDNELLGSVDIDVFEYISSDYLTKQSLESQLDFLNLLKEKGVLSIIETPYDLKVSMFNPGSNIDFPLSMRSLVFEEFDILDMDFSQLSEVPIDFNKFIDQPETCGQMPMEDMNFRNFNELVVSHELALVDGIFKSLPIPILADNEEVSLYAIVEELLAKIKPLPLSASDGIYLDWLLWEQDNGEFDIFSSYRDILQEIEFYSNDYNQMSVDPSVLVYDYIFSSDASNEANTEESKVVVDMLSDAISLPEEHFSGVGSSKSLDNGCAKPENGEALSEVDAEKVSLLSESISQFSDLDFFLNPQKGTAKGNTELPGKMWTEVPEGLGVGVDLPQDTGFTVGRQFHSKVARNEILNEQKSEDLLNCVPVEDDCNVRSSVPADELEIDSTSVTDDCVMLAKESVHVQPRKPSFKDMIIVMNTQNSDKEMIISRRSTYQKILAMEKDGARVVERDSTLPVDIIISTAICLVWYDCRNIGKKTTSLENASSGLSLCLENIATNVLTLLSFSFSGCILVFEGEFSFLSAIMESSDVLYAASASLGIDLQLFCSYSADLTDQIVLGCIGHATKSTRGLYPKMPESETLAESFLTKFPSINALTAHAIISSVGALVEFFKWPHEHRILAIQKYHVPDESVSIFSSLCRYMEREDSKSGMTDSSSVSSAPDSEKSQCKVGSERKKRKHVASTVQFNMPVDDLLHFAPFNEYTGDRSDTFRAPRLPYSGIARTPQTFNEFKGPNFFPNDNLFSQNHRSDTVIRNLDQQKISESNGLQDDYIGEVIDFNDSSFFCETLSSTENPSFSCFVPEFEKEPLVRNSETTRRLSFGKNRHPAFPPSAGTNSDSNISSTMKNHKRNFDQDISACDVTDFCNDSMPLEHQKEFMEVGSTCKNSCPTFPSAADINSDPNIWRTMKDHKRNYSQDISGYDTTEFNNCTMSLENQKELREVDSARKSVRNSHGLLTQVRSGQLQGSPWTIEFLNRVREKSRMHKQAIPSDMPTLSFGYSGNVSNVPKRKSPSTIDCYKYQGGSVPRKTKEWKRQKLSVPPSMSSKDQGRGGPIPQTWTPVDKRARKTLSFTTNGSGSQTKLVWGNGKAQGMKRRF